MRDVTIGLGLLALLSGCVVNAPPVAERTPDGLVRVPSAQADTVYRAPGASLGSYRRVMLDPVDLAFKLDWQQKNPDVTASDVTRIRSQGIAIFNEIFSSALTLQHGYPITTQPAPDVLRISASITELDVSAAPGTAGSQRMFIVSPSDLTLTLELRDSQSGALLARAIDKEKGRTFGNLKVEGSVENSAEARRALEMWAGLLRAALDNARGTPQVP
ncbi:MAG TPA: DUF3313 family protein [Steroidobacteraceae bacterium]|nr:DUF3313 family protein [Steroidobacteraceae bacterium]